MTNSNLKELSNENRLLILGKQDPIENFFKFIMVGLIVFFLFLGLIQWEAYRHINKEITVRKTLDLSNIGYVELSDSGFPSLKNGKRIDGMFRFNVTAESWKNSVKSNRSI